MKSNISEATIAGSFNSELNNMGHNFWLENEWLNESINFLRLRNIYPKMEKMAEIALIAKCF
ncbi:hypothetical protein [Mesomycoplasma hyopneumoniae]|uniref:hypothetical protein n=1 Tax=Mesomycoplasma hyopneumoniae TaxID=2099 RepID=UPI00215D62F2|nr:hypothetical protein [Mesomycoplasma hyopneumoniae]